MIFILGLVLIFFLPLIESVNRSIGLNILLIGSLLISFDVFWHRKIRLNFIDSLWILLLVVFSASTLFSISVARSFLELLRYFGYFLVFIAIRNYSHPEKIFTRFYYPMVIVNSLIASFISLLYFIPGMVLPKPLDGMNFFYSTFGHNHISDILIFAISLVLLGSGKFRNTLAAIFILMLTVSASRASMLILTFVLIIYLLNIKKGFGISKWVLILSFLTISFLASAFIFSNFNTVNIDFLNHWKGFIKPVWNENRLNYLWQSAHGFRMSPIIGTGLDTFRYISMMFKSHLSEWSWYTHNHFAEIFSEAGILGGLIFSLLIIIILVRSGKRIVNVENEQKNQYIAGLSIAILASSLKSLVDFDWQFLSVFLLFWMGAALILPQFDKHGLVLKSYIWKLVFLVFIVLFSVGIFLPLDSADYLRKADDLITRFKLPEAKELLLKSYRLDGGNPKISAKLQYIYELLNTKNQLRNVP